MSSGPSDWVRVFYCLCAHPTKKRMCLRIQKQEMCVGNRVCFRRGVFCRCGETPRGSDWSGVPDPIKFPS